MSSKAIVFLLCLGLLSSSCTFNRFKNFPGDKAYLPKRTDLTNFVYGHWIVMEDSLGRSFQGELLAVETEKLVLLSPSNGLLQVNRQEVSTTKIWLHMSESQANQVYVTGMMATCFTHGFFALLTVPMWIGTNLATSRSLKSRPNTLELQASDWEKLRSFARFPMGMPEGLDVGRLRRASKDN